MKLLKIPADVAAKARPEDSATPRSLAAWLAETPRQQDRLCRAFAAADDFKTVHDELMVAYYTRVNARFNRARDAQRIALAADIRSLLPRALDIEPRAWPLLRGAIAEAEGFAEAPRRGAPSKDRAGLERALRDAGLRKKDRRLVLLLIGRK